MELHWPKLPKCKIHDLLKYVQYYILKIHVSRFDVWGFLFAFCFCYLSCLVSYVHRGGNVKKKNCTD